MNTRDADGAERPPAVGVGRVLGAVAGARSCQTNGTPRDLFRDDAASPHDPSAGPRSIRSATYGSARARPRLHRRPGGRPGPAGARRRGAPPARRPAVPAPRRSATARAARGDGLGRRRGAPGALPAPARSVHVAGRYEVHPRFGAQLAVRGVAPAGRGQLRLERPARRPAARRPRAMEADLRELVATVQDPHLRALLDACSARARRPWAALPRGAGGQALPPGLPPRAARALADGRPGRQRRSARRSRASTATSRSPARCCTTSASSRPTRPTRRAIDLTDAGKLQGEIPLGYYRVRRAIEDLDGFPPELAAGRAAHHPHPPRRARARHRPSSRARARRRSCT